MRAMWGEEIDIDRENRDFMRLLEKRAGTRIDDLKFPPLCPTCLAENPDGVYPLRVPQGHRAGLVRPIYVPHCRHCGISGRHIKVNFWWWLLLGISVLGLAALGLYYLFLRQYPAGQAETRPADLFSQPLIWIALAALVAAAYFLHRKGISLYAINESTVIFSFLHRAYCERFREANRIGVRKRAEELEAWEARYCPNCGRPVGRGHDYCPYCGHLVAGAEQTGLEQPAGEVSAKSPAVPERATAGGQAVSDWPKVIYCECGRKYRIFKPGTYQCVDPKCGKVFVVE